MGVKVLKRKIGILNLKAIINRKLEGVFNILGGKHMEGIDRSQFNLDKIRSEKSFIRVIFEDVSERSKIFYNKYLRSTVHYDHLEMKRIKKHNLESVLWDAIRSQW